MRNPKTMTLAEIAKRSGLSATKLKKLLEDHQVPLIDADGTPSIVLDHFHRWAEANQDAIRRLIIRSTQGALDL